MVLALSSVSANKTHSYCKGHKGLVILHGNLNVTILEILLWELSRGGSPSPQSLAVFKCVRELNHGIRVPRSFDTVWLTKSSWSEFSFSRLLSPFSCQAVMPTGTPQQPVEIFLFLLRNRAREWGGRTWEMAQGIKPCHISIRIKVCIPGMHINDPGSPPDSSVLIQNTVTRSPRASWLAESASSWFKWGLCLSM